MSSPANDSLPPQIANLSSIWCFDNISMPLSLSFILTNIPLLPLSVFVLYLGHQRWRRQRSVSTAAIMSHSDFFTYNMAVMELIGVLGNVISCCGNFANLLMMKVVGSVIGVFPWYGQMFFPLLTCVDRYLAVVHPITYLRLRQARGVMIRNIITGFVWMQCFGGLVCMFFYMFLSFNQKYNLIPSACYMVMSLVIMTFCSLSVLRVLIRPRPGEAGTDRVRVDKSKQRAFHTILVIMGVLSLRFGGNLACNVVSSLLTMSDSVRCEINVSVFWFNLPSSLVLPLLYLHRAGKLHGCKRNTESG